MSPFCKYSLLALRVGLGILFLWSGLNKLSSDFSAAGYLNNAVRGPFAELFSSMAGNGVVDFLVVWGEILIGLALISGTLLRFASLCGCIMMLLFYASSFPPSTGYISQHIIYILVFIHLSAAGAGRFVGLDSFLERNLSASGPSRWRYLLG
jgi:thiosulfate dehydrogenase [quinone] large subunit